MEHQTKIILSILNRSHLEDISYLYETKSEYNFEGTVTVNEEEYNIISPLVDIATDRIKVTCTDNIEAKKGTLYTLYIYSNTQKIKNSDLPETI